MRTITVLFFSTVYWNDKEILETAKKDIGSKFKDTTVISVIDGDFSEAMKYIDFDTLIAVPCSGAVQPKIVEYSENFDKVIIFAGYVPGNYDLDVTDRMLLSNAAPALMDVYGVLKRNHKKTVSLQRSFAELEKFRKIMEAYEYVRNGKITLIKGPEPWVISVSRDFKNYERQLGLKVDLTTQEELIDLYNQTTSKEAMDIYEYYKKDAFEIVEPIDDDIMKCSRLAKAMLKLIEKHQSTGIAIACFNLIGVIGVNPCLGVSYINGETDYFAACEGDIDSAVTMLMMHGLTKEKPWMANPCLQSDETVNFAHCTAPLRVKGEKQKFLLRNHHETGVGVSPRVFYDHDMTMSMFRYSGVTNTMTINKGTSMEGRYEPNCRTQVRLAIDDYPHYIETNIGCHQVMTFENINRDMKMLCELLRVKIG